MNKSFISIILPLVAGLLHLNVFYQSVFKFITVPLEDNDDSDMLFQMAYIFDKSVFFAYVFDLFCCYGFNLRPFSRCSTNLEIFLHHAPIILTILPLGIPLWAKMIDFDRTLHEIMGTNSMHADYALRTQMLRSLRKANGWGFISSLNEFFMCFQRAEMNMFGIPAFQNVAEFKEGRKFMTSRFAIGLELYFKLGIFWIFPLISFKECFCIDKIWYDYHRMLNPDSSVLSFVMSICSSATMLRTLVFRAFMFFLYPNMGLRTFRKLMTFHGKVTKRGGGIREVKKD